MVTKHVANEEAASDLLLLGVTSWQNDCGECVLFTRCTAARVFHSHETHCATASVLLV